MGTRGKALLLDATRLVGDLSYQERPRGQFTKQGLHAPYKDSRSLTQVTCLCYRPRANLTPTRLKRPRPHILWLLFVICSCYVLTAYWRRKRMQTEKIQHNQAETSDRELSQLIRIAECTGLSLDFLYDHARGLDQLRFSAFCKWALSFPK